MRSSLLERDRILSIPPKNCLLLEERSALTPDVRDLLLRAAWGTPGHGRLYRIETLDFFDSLPALDFHNLRDLKRRLIASRFFRVHTILMDGRAVKAIYHNFSAVEPELQGRGFGGQLAAESRDALLQKLSPQGGIVYTYVERDNVRHAHILRKAGYEAVGEFWTVTIYVRFDNIPYALQREFHDRLKTFSPHNL